MRDAGSIAVWIILASATTVSAADPPSLADTVAEALRQARAEGRLTRVLAPMALKREREPAPPQPADDDRPAVVVVVDEGSKVAPERETGDWIAARGEDLGGAVRFELESRSVWQAVPHDPTVSSESSTLSFEVGEDGHVRWFELESEQVMDGLAASFSASGVVEGGKARIETVMSDPRGGVERRTIDHAFGDDAALPQVDRLVLARLVHARFPSELAYRALVFSPRGASDQPWTLACKLDGGVARLTLSGSGRHEVEVAGGELRSLRDLPGNGAVSRWVPSAMPARGMSRGLMLGLIALTLACVAGLVVALVRKKRATTAAD